MKALIFLFLFSSIALAQHDTPVLRTKGGTGPWLSADSLKFLRSNGKLMPTWEVASGGGMSIGGSVAGGSSGSVPFIGGTGNLTQDNNNLFYDSSCKCLAIASNGNGANVAFNVGPNFEFQVNSAGDIISIKGVTYSYPGSQGAVNSFLRNDGSGGLTWIQDTTWIRFDGNTNMFAYNSGNPTLTGTYNTAFGISSLSSCKSCGQNTAIGFDALSQDTSSGTNTAVGSGALANLITGLGNNVAIGNYTLTRDSAGKYNVAIGTNAGVNPSTSINHHEDCIFLGSFSGYTAPIVFTNTFIAGDYSHPIYDVYFGGGYQSHSGSNGLSYTIHGTGAGDGTDKNGGDLILSGGVSTGSGTEGDVSFMVAQAGGSGTAVNTSYERARITSYGLTVNKASTNSIGTVSLSSSIATVTNAHVTNAHSRIFVTSQDNNVTGALRVVITDNTNFTITDLVPAESGTVAYFIVEEN